MILTGKRVLVVEDEYFIAEGLVRDLRRLEAVPLGPVPTVTEALEVIRAERLDGAVLDVNLRGDMSFPVADALMARGVPFVFATGYTSDSLPARYASVPCCDKPVQAEALATALFGHPAS